MDHDKDLKVYSYLLIPITPERLTEIINALQLAKQKTLPGQTQIVPIHSQVAFTYNPAPAKKPVDEPTGYSINSKV